MDNKESFPPEVYVRQSNKYGCKIIYNCHELSYRRATKKNTFIIALFNLNYPTKTLSKIQNNKNKTSLS